MTDLHPRAEAYSRWGCSPAGESRQPMLTVDTAISRVRRDLTLGWVLRATFAAAIVASFALPLMGASFEPAFGLAVVAVAWVMLNSQGVRGARLAAASPSLISSGRFEE